MIRFMIGGTHSGCGKTTVTCAVLAALKARGHDVAAFKCGPDYIDPMFHRSVIGVESHNLDSFFCDARTLNSILGEYSREVSVIEGVMGFYDGAVGSAYSVSQITETPAVIVIDCKGMSDSAGAVMSGFLNYRRPNRIVGFIFDRLPQKLVPMVKRLCDELGTEYLGCLPKHGEVFGSRHLGLVTAEEIAGLREKLKRLGELAEEHICLDKLLSLEAPERCERIEVTPPTAGGKPVIAAARDRAFCFEYAENHALLEKLGCEVRYFSPLADGELPEADGLILCGGYPELYAKELSENSSMLRSVKAAVASGMPTIAECGGFMYLHRELTDEQGDTYPMAGVIDGRAYPTEHLRRFGYVTMTAARDGLLCGAGGRLKAHEFHYWDSTSCGDGFKAEKPDGRSWECCHVSGSLYAGFPHIYFYSDIRAAERFVSACAEYRKRK